MLSRSVFGEFLSLYAKERPRGPALNCYEETISTVEDPPQTATRILEPQFQQERQSYFAQSAPGWAQEVNSGLNSLAWPMAALSPGCFRFSRDSRIKQRRDFIRVRQDGERLVFGCLIMNWRRLTPGARSRLGVITSSKIGGATVRSRARRLLRESFRLHQQQLNQPVDLVLVARSSICGKAFVEVEKDFLTSLRKAGLMKATGAS
jgi:ribonuclease P protein component